MALHILLFLQSLLTKIKLLIFLCACLTQTFKYYSPLSGNNILSLYSYKIFLYQATSRFDLCVLLLDFWSLFCTIPYAVYIMLLCLYVMVTCFRLVYFCPCNDILPQLWNCLNTRVFKSGIFLFTYLLNLKWSSFDYSSTKLKL